MSTNETRLREALERLHCRCILSSAHLNALDKDALEYARRVLQETAPEPPKHPATVAWEKQPGTVHRTCYMQGFKDALLWALEKADKDGGVAYSVLRDTANSVPQ